MSVQNGQTPLNIAQKLGYISVIETLKVVTETTTITTTTTTTMEEKYKVVAPEGMHETFMSDSEEEGGKDYLSLHFGLRNSFAAYHSIRCMDSFFGTCSIIKDLFNHPYDRLTLIGQS